MNQELQELIESNKIFAIVYDTLANILFDNANIVNPSRQKRIAQDLTDKIMKDRDALKEKDPAAKLFAGERSNEYVLSYKSLEAVMMYRISNYIYNFEDNDFENSIEIKSIYQTQARALSEKTKANTSVEIHPAAQIGHGFVIDHGCATVIGETCEIGNDCYILHAVTLGAKEFGEGSPTGRRHPKLGNNVKVGGYARLFGNISVGDNTDILGYTVVERDIPSNKKVSVVNQIQLCHPHTDTEPIVIYGLRPCNDFLEIIGKNLDSCTTIELLNSDSNNIKHFQTTIENKSDTSLLFTINNIDDIITDKEIKSYKISVNYNEGNILLANSIGWNDYIKAKNVKK
ncbi:hypothetical protein AGMMS49965_10650 [Bacteroidia bacterium]|nr:hypothetical protein AGMMS49965_10650 [Bacteroidia bacterium]